jgi:cysteine-rich repeat protein
MTLSLSKRKGWSGATLCAGFVLAIGCGAPSDEAGDLGTEADAYRGPRGSERGHGAGKGAAHGKGGKSQGKGQGKGHGKGNGHGKGHGHGHGHDDDCDHGSSAGGTGSGTGSAGTTSGAGTFTGGGSGGAFASGGSSNAGTGSATGGSGGGFSGPAVCGDGARSFPEQCDDANTEAGDGCSAACVLEAGYYCDYYTGCAPVVCGDGAIQWYGDGNGGWLNEECDDTNSESGDGCSASCLLEPGHTCYWVGEPCREVFCGDSSTDGYLLPDGSWTWESCDDGNDLAGDGCSSECQIEPGHVCEYNGACHPVVCGDGFQDSYFVPGDGQGTGGSGFAGAGGYGGGSSGYYVYEQCDDANTASGDGCSDACELEPGYVCDPPGTPCRIPACGDGFRDWVPGPGSGGGWGGSAGAVGFAGTVSFAGAGGTSGGGEPMHYEACDDGNLTSGDGCNDECVPEAGYTCDVAGQPCKLAVCGDGYYDWPYEQCDDGNTTSGDGCSSTCAYEWIGTGGAAGGWSGGSAGAWSGGSGGSPVMGGWGGSG